MNERLKEFMQAEELTSVKFAEIMGVQPSSISHLLSGRNYPNYDFLSKILLRFPRLNPDWIINGKGSIYRSEQKAETTTETSSNFNVTNVNHAKVGAKESVITNVIIPINDDKADIFSSLKEVESRITEGNQFDNEVIDNNYAERDLLITNVNEKVDEPVSKVPDLANEGDNSTCTFSAPGADRIVMFYADGTFKEYLKR